MGELSEGFHQPLLVVLVVCLGLNKQLHQLVIRVLEQADEHIQGRAAVGDKLAIDLLRQN